MKATLTYNKYRTVHEWKPTAVSRYFHAACDRNWQVHESSLHADTSGPHCKMCFPEGKTSESGKP